MGDWGEKANVWYLVIKPNIRILKVASNLEHKPNFSEKKTLRDDKKKSVLKLCLDEFMVEMSAFADHVVNKIIIT